MGQQQLLLLVLGIIIVSLAVVVGIDTYSDNQAKSREDALVNTALRLGSEIQGWARKGDLYGGLNGWSNIDGSSFDFAHIGLPSGQEYDSDAGTFTVSGSTGEVVLTGEDADTESIIKVTLTGPNSEDIDVEIEYGS